jgi:hypothetical protein
LSGGKEEGGGGVEVTKVDGGDGRVMVGDDLKGLAKRASACDFAKTDDGCNFT